MNERRRETRKKLMAFTPIYDLRHGTILGYLGDLTLQGAMLIGEHPLPVGNLNILAIEFPGELEGIAVRRTTIRAQVARCLPAEGSQDYMIGFEFLDLDEEHTRMIQALLERYHFRYQMDGSG